MIKLVVGVESLEDYAAVLKDHLVPYQGQMANRVWTRYAPKRAEELIKSGSIYRVIKNRIQCRQRILGFEQVEHPVKGTMCQIMTEAALIRTVSMPKRPFQGWRYLKPVDAPADIGLYQYGEDRPPEEMEAELSALGLI